MESPIPFRVTGRPISLAAGNPGSITSFGPFSPGDRIDGVSVAISGHDGHAAITAHLYVTPTDPRGNSLQAESTGIRLLDPSGCPLPVAVAENAAGSGAFSWLDAFIPAPFEFTQSRRWLTVVLAQPLATTCSGSIFLHPSGRLSEESL